MDLTENQLRTLSFLTRHFREKHSINWLAKQLHLTPTGMHKLLKRLEEQKMVSPLKLANAIFYAVAFDSDLACQAAQLSLFEQPRLPYARVQAKDLQRLRQYALAAILFGSVLTKGEKAGDIDVIFIIEQNNYDAFLKELEKLQRLKPKRIQPVLQAPEDLIKNLRKPDPVILNALKTGNILWGQDIIVKSIRQAEHDGR